MASFASAPVSGWLLGDVLAANPITTLPCKDGYITFSASAPHQWDYVCAMIGREDLLIDPRFSSFQSLKDAADEIDEILLEWVADKTRQEIVELAAGVYSVPASPVFDLRETMQDSQYIERGLFAQFDHPQDGGTTFPLVPFHMSATQPRFSPAPSLGEHNGLMVAARNKSRKSQDGRKGRQVRKQAEDWLAERHPRHRLDACMGRSPRRSYPSRLRRACSQGVRSTHSYRPHQRR